MENNGLFYVGATTTTLKQRLYAHRGNANNPKQIYKCSSSKLFERRPEKCRISLLEEFSCKSKKELEAKEKDYIIEYAKKCNCVNIVNHPQNKSKRIKQKRQLTPAKIECLTRARNAKKHRQMFRKVLEEILNTTKKIMSIPRHTEKKETIIFYRGRRKILQ